MRYPDRSENFGTTYGLCALQTIDNPHFRLIEQMTDYRGSMASDKWRPSSEKSKAFQQGLSLSTTRGSPRIQGL